MSELLPVHCRQCGRMLGVFTRFVMLPRPVTFVCLECGGSRVWAPAPKPMRDADVQGESEEEEETGY